MDRMEAGGTDMDKELRLRFAETLSKLEGKDYIEAMVAFAAAPTIHGKKPASLMSFNSYGKNTAVQWRKYGAEICESFQLEQFEMKNGKDCLMVLLYRKKLLEWYVSHRRNQTFLRKMGYGFADCLQQKLEILKQRFEKLCPHEVGVFLGMPVEDVEGFIEHKGKNCLLCRYWKVYGNPQRTEILFSAYDKARKSMAEFVVNLKADKMAECI